MTVTGSNLDGSSDCDDVLIAAFMVSHLRPHCENCNTIETPQWRKGWYSDFLGHPVNLCNACGLKYHKGQCCPYCKFTYGKETKMTKDWIPCFDCGRWTHYACESLHGGRQDDDRYVCPECRDGVVSSYNSRIKERSTTPYGLPTSPSSSPTSTNMYYSSSYSDDSDQPISSHSNVNESNYKRSEQHFHSQPSSSI